MNNLFMKDPSKKGKKTIIFDLDETLAYIIQTPIINSSVSANTYTIPAPSVNPMQPNKNRFLQVCIRPGC